MPIEFFFHAKAKRDVYVRLPDEDKAEGQEGTCGKFNCSMYGTRGAAQNWQAEISQPLVNSGFTHGAASPCVFYHEARGIRTLGHGDDYVSVGTPCQLKRFEEQLERKYKIKTQLLGFGGEQLRELKISNGIVAWNGGKGLTYEADPRHVEIVVEQYQLSEAKTVTTLVAREEGATQSDAQEMLDGEEASNHRVLVVRCSYICPGRPYISFAVKELAGQMSAPTKGNWAQLKRFGRYLKGRPRLHQQYEWQPTFSVLRIYYDADWTGCKGIWKSSIGGCITLGKHKVKGRSKIQSLVVLSPGESALCATFKAAAETLAVLSLLKASGRQVTREVWGGEGGAPAQPLGPSTEEVWVKPSI